MSYRDGDGQTSERFRNKPPNIRDDRSKTVCTSKSSSGRDGGNGRFEQAFVFGILEKVQGDAGCGEDSLC
jgi:hypothetical protein